MNVVKWDGCREPFRRSKVKRTLLRMGAPPKLAERLARHIEERSYEGITTREILEMIYESLEKHKSVIAFRRDLRDALARIPSAPDFEEYVRIVLRADGYTVAPNQVIRGYCVTHEIDGIAEKDGKKAYLEVKHHADVHSYTPFDVTLAAKAKLDDMIEGYRHEMNRYSFDSVLIVCNTRLTKHAEKYANCVGLHHIGWNVPRRHGFDKLIDEHRLYPITMVDGLNDKERDELSQEGILTMRQLIEVGAAKVGISKSRMRELTEKAERIIKKH